MRNQCNHCNGNIWKPMQPIANGNTMQTNARTGCCADREDACRNMHAVFPKLSWRLFHGITGQSAGYQIIFVVSSSTHTVKKFNLSLTTNNIFNDYCRCNSCVTHTVKKFNLSLTSSNIFNDYADAIVVFVGSPFLPAGPILWRTLSFT